MKGLGVILCSAFCMHIVLFYVVSWFIQRQEDVGILTPSSYERGSLQYQATNRFVNTVKWSRPDFMTQLSLLKMNRLSSLGFDYSSYYAPGMTSPNHLQEPTTKWNAGDPVFVNYMNDVYIPLQKREVSNATSTLIYQKRANAGIANQIMGVCDTLILGVVYNRSIQINAPALPSHFFDYPLFNLTFPAPLTYPSEEARLSLVTSVVNDSITYIEFTSRASIPGITDVYQFNNLYKGLVVFESGTSFLRQIFRHPKVRQFARAIITPNANATVSRNSWYNTCFHGLFQPSAFAWKFIEPWVRVFEEHFMIGAHIRLAGNLTTWREKAAALSFSQVEAQMSVMKSMLDEKPNAMLFLTTDNRWVEKEMMRRFEDRLLFVGNLPRTHTGTFTNEAGLMRTFTELYLLGKCDVLFLTDRSSYSRLANSIKKESAQVFFF